MRLLLINSGFDELGAHRGSVDLFHYFRDAGWQVTYFVPNKQPEHPDCVVGIRISGERFLRALEYLRRPIDWRHIGSRYHLDKITMRDYDVVHLHNIHGGWLSLKSVQRLARRVPTVWTLHDEWAITEGLPYDLSRHLRPSDIVNLWPHSDFLYSQNSYARKWRERIHPLMPRPSAIICPSSYLIQLVTENHTFDGVSITQVPYGLRSLELSESSMPQSAARRMFGIGEDANVILWAASNLVSPYKGVHYAIDTLKLVDRSAVILLIGYSTETIIRSVPQRVVAPGFLSRDDEVLAAYRASNVVLVPSVADNFPYVALDALATQTPLVAFSVGGLTEIVGNNERGLLAEPFSIRQMASNIEALLADTNMAKSLGQSGLTWARNRCSRTQFFMAHERIYDRCLSVTSKVTDST